MRIIDRDGTDGVPEAFTALPHQLRHDDPLWIPEEERAVRRAFDRANPWFAHGRAASLCIPGEARLAVFRDERAVLDGKPAAFFGYFESVPDGRAARALLAEAERWARVAGAEVLCGPIDFTTAGRYRLLVSAEPGVLPFPGEPDNPAWYPGLLEDAGYAIVRRYFSQVGRIRPAPLEEKLVMRRRIEEAGYTLEPVDAARWLSLLPALYEAADDIFGENLAYTPSSFEEFAAGFGATAARMLCPHTSLAAWGPDGDLAGFVLAQPHWGPLLVQGAIPPRVCASELSYDAHASRLAALGVDTAIAKTVGVRRAHRGRGLMDAMGYTVVERGRGRYSRWIGAMIRDDNVSQRFGAPHAEHLRHYALYGRPIAGTADAGEPRARGA